MEEDPLYDVKGAAIYFGGVSVWSVYAWIHSGRLAKTKVSRRTMIRKSELDRFIAESNK